MSMTERTALLLGEEGVQALANAHVLLFGIGGVGGYVAEALARAGVGRLTLVDRDTVSESNLNRQILALRSTLGKSKVEVAAGRIGDINPACHVVTHQMFYTKDTADQISFDGVDVVVDAVDTVSAKLEILARAREAGIQVISSMGTAGKLHPERLCLTTLEKTTGCPLARIMRKECKKRGLANIPVVYSTEEAPPPVLFDPDSGKPINGSVSFVPGAAGLLLAGWVVRQICGLEKAEMKSGSEARR